MTNSTESSHLHSLSALQQTRELTEGRVSAFELVEHSLLRIADLDENLNAFAYVRREAALREAEALDKRFETAGAPAGPLHGLPVAIKQENHVAGLPTEYGGAAFTTLATEDSEVVRRLRAAGAVIIGTTRMPEFGMWPYTESVAHGWTRNPWNPLCSTAGSSGGSAAAVASGMVAAAIGGDGGGSIRLPASWCGLFGLKAQRGRVSAAPNPDLWRALGVLGPLTRTVADSALIYDAISGSTSVDRFDAPPMESTLSAAAQKDPRTLRIRVSTSNPRRMGGPDAETLGAVKEAAQLLSSLGHDVTFNDLEYPRLGLQSRAMMAGGVADEANRADHPELLEARTRQRLKAANRLQRLSNWAERTAAEQGGTFLDELFEDADVILTPTTPTAAEPIGQLNEVSERTIGKKALRVSSFTSIWNVLGNPAAAVPMGQTKSGLPLSVQLIGPTASEALLVSLSAQIEGAKPWRQLADIMTF